MNTLKYFLVDDDKHKAIVHQFYFVVEVLKADVKHRVFVKCTVDMEDHSHSMPNILEDH